MPRVLTHFPPDMNLTSRELAADREQRQAERAAVKSLRDLEEELREQASGSQDGYLLDVANRMRDALRQL